MILSSGTITEVTYETNKTDKKIKKNNYFDVREEEAVKAYIIAETKIEKDLIYNEFLRYPLDKMIESIIRRYSYIVKIWTITTFIVIHIHS
jgi:hypothetical protein